RDARYPLHAGGPDDEALPAHYAAVKQLRDWASTAGQPSCAARPSPGSPPDSREAAVTAGKPGILAQLRGDYDTAEPLYRRTRDISERIGDRGPAASYHQLGTLAQDWGTTTPPSLVPPRSGHPRADQRPGRHGHQLCRPGWL